MRFQSKFSRFWAVSYSPENQKKTIVTFCYRLKNFTQYTSLSHSCQVSGRIADYVHHFQQKETKNNFQKKDKSKQTVTKK